KTAAKGGRGNLDERAGPHDVRQAQRGSVNVGIALRMGEYRCDPFAHQLDHARFQVQRPAEVRKLEEEVRRVSRQSETTEVVQRDELEVVERDLSAAQHLEWNRLLLELSLETVQALL